MKSTSALDSIINSKNCVSSIVDNTVFDEKIELDANSNTSHRQVIQGINSVDVKNIHSTRSVDNTSKVSDLEVNSSNNQRVISSTTKSNISLSMHSSISPCATSSIIDSSSNDVLANANCNIVIRPSISKEHLSKKHPKLQSVSKNISQSQSSKIVSNNTPSLKSIHGVQCASNHKNNISGKTLISIVSKKIPKISRITTTALIPESSKTKKHSDIQTENMSQHIKETIDKVSQSFAVNADLKCASKESCPVIEKKPTFSNCKQISQSVTHEEGQSDIKLKPKVRQYAKKLFTASSIPTETTVINDEDGKHSRLNDSTSSVPSNSCPLIKTSQTSVVNSYGKKTSSYHAKQSLNNNLSTSETKQCKQIQNEYLPEPVIQYSNTKGNHQALHQSQASSSHSHYLNVCNDNSGHSISLHAPVSGNASALNNLHSYSREIPSQPLFKNADKSHSTNIPLSKESSSKFLHTHSHCNNVTKIIPRACVPNKLLHGHRIYLPNGKLYVFQLSKPVSLILPQPYIQKTNQVKTWIAKSSNSPKSPNDLILVHEATAEQSASYMKLIPFYSLGVREDFERLTVENKQVTLLVNTECVQRHNFPNGETVFLLENKSNIILIYGIPSYQLSPSLLCSTFKNPIIEKRFDVKNNGILNLKPFQFLKIECNSLIMDPLIIPHSLSLRRQVFKCSGTSLICQPHMQPLVYIGPRTDSKINNEFKKQGSLEIEGFDKIDDCSPPKKLQKIYSRPSLTCNLNSLLKDKTELERKKSSSKQNDSCKKDSFVFNNKSKIKDNIKSKKCNSIDEKSIPGVGMNVEDSVRPPTIAPAQFPLIDHHTPLKSKKLCSALLSKDMKKSENLVSPKHSTTTSSTKQALSIAMKAAKKKHCKQLTKFGKQLSRSSKRIKNELSSIATPLLKVCKKVTNLSKSENPLQNIDVEEKRLSTSRVQGRTHCSSQNISIHKREKPKPARFKRVLQIPVSKQSKSDRIHDPKLSNFDLSTQKYMSNSQFLTPNVVQRSNITSKCHATNDQQSFGNHLLKQKEPPSDHLKNHRFQFREELFSDSKPQELCVTGRSECKSKDHPHLSLQSHKELHLNEINHDHVSFSARQSSNSHNCKQNFDGFCTSSQGDHRFNDIPVSIAHDSPFSKHSTHPVWQRIQQQNINESCRYREEYKPNQQNCPQPRQPDILPLLQPPDNSSNSCLVSTSLSAQINRKQVAQSNAQTRLPLQPTALELYTLPRQPSPAKKKLQALGGLYVPEIYHEDGQSFR